MRKSTLIPVLITVLLGVGAAVPRPPAALAQTDTAQPAPERPSRIEGRIAFLQTELHITDAQMALWKPVADALRDNDRVMREAFARLRQARTANLGAVDRLESWQKLSAARAESLGKLLAAFKPLYEAMSDDQKKNADELLASRFGRMHHTQF